MSLLLIREVHHKPCHDGKVKGQAAAALKPLLNCGYSSQHLLLDADLSD
jgi:hypothetical protein